MQTYFNATTGAIELPRHDGNGSVRLGPGESFNGPPFYDQFILSGLLAKTDAEGAVHYIYVSKADFTNPATSQIYTQAYANDETTKMAFRYKANINVPSPTLEDLTTTNSAWLKVKAIIHYSLDAVENDPVFISYYFYTSFYNCTMPTHVITRTERMSRSWAFPTWATLPSNFYDLSLLEQEEALMTTQ